MNSYPIEKIAILRFSSLGDVVLAACIFKHLRNAFPRAQICFITGEPYSELFIGNHMIDKVISVPLDGSLKEEMSAFKQLWISDFDLIIDLHDNLRSNWLKHILVPQRIITWDKARTERINQLRGKENLQHTERRPVKPVWQRYLDTLKTIGIHIESGYKLENPILPVSAAPEVLQSHGLNPDKAIGIAFGSRHFTKRWMIDRYAELAVALSDNGNNIILFGADSEYYDGDAIRRDNPRIWNACGLPLPDVARVAATCQLVISNDSGVAHLAEAVSTPVLVIFGGTHLVLGFGPCLPESKALSLNLSCSPCHLHGRSSCPLKHFNCMKNLSTETVLQETLNTLSSL